MREIKMNVEHILGLDLGSPVGVDVLLRGRLRPDDPLFFSFTLCRRQCFSCDAAAQDALNDSGVVLWDVPSALKLPGRGHHIRGRCWHAPGLSLQACPCLGRGCCHGHLTPVCCLVSPPSGQWRSWCRPTSGRVYPPQTRTEHLLIWWDLASPHLTTMRLNSAQFSWKTYLYSVLQLANLVKPGSRSKATMKHTRECKITAVRILWTREKLTFYLRSLKCNNCKQTKNVPCRSSSVEWRCYSAQ